ncbi:Ig-like domain-containing protein [Acetivibrio clariflavus]|uniref:Ig-like domain-containing protein n=1 Tax=Acetivibrio clariflavus TaxID=288965 RepID=UPI000482CA7C|nr:Ig-like domain-containing protein [Acetivibrio clariflavus]
MKILKKFLGIIVAASVISSIAIVPVSANTYIYEKEANILYKLGLYKGINETRFDPDLGTALDRQTGVVMLLRIFGQEEEAKTLTYDKANAILSKFKDADKIADWSKRQVAYAVEKGYVKGYSEDSTFRPTSGLNGKAYCSLILQQLGYDGDFQYDKAAIKLSEVGGLTTIQANLFNSDTTLIKDSLVGISYGALQAKYKADGEKLIKKLIEKGIVSEEKAREAGFEYVKIVSVDDIEDIVVSVGVAPKLPTSIGVEYDDGTKGTVNVSWPYIDTSKIGEQTVFGTISGTSVKAKVKITVIPDKLSVNAVSSGNLKEIIIEFSKPVENEDEAKDKRNYDVEGNSVINAELSDDKMTVTLLLKNALKQQSNVEVTVDKKVGLEEDAELRINNIKDITTPEIVDVTAVGNGLVKVTFSEPVQNAATVSNYTIDGKLFGASEATLSSNGKTVSFYLLRRLSSGSHKLAVKNKVSDYAGYIVEDNEISFTVDKDDTAPTAKIISATQTKVVILFSEEIEKPEEDNIITDSKASIEKIELADDNKTLTVYFDIKNALPVAGCKLIIEDVTDFSGNSADIKLNVTPDYDVTRPEYVGYVIKNQKEIVLEFSEEVFSEYGEFELKDSDGDSIPLSDPVYYTEDGEYIKNKLVLKRIDGVEFESGNYELTISGVTDLNPLKNVMIEKTVKITVDDKTPPSVSDVYINKEDNKLYIKFNEDVDERSATDYSNYLCTVNGIAWRINKRSAKIELLSDEQTVCITFSSDKNDYDEEVILVEKISRVQVEAVRDKKGNEMSAVSISSKDFKSDNTTAPKIISAAATDKNTIVVKIKGSINANTLEPDDFYITAGKDKYGNDIVITAWDAVYDADNNEIILTVNADIESDGTFNGKSIYLDLEDEDDIDTVNIFNQKLSISSSIKVTEDFKPVAKSIDSAYYEKNVGTIVYVRLSENLKLIHGEQLNANDSSQFRIKVNGKTVDAKIYYYNAESKDDKDTDVDETYARFKIVIEGNHRGDKVQVIFYRATKATIVDASGNALDDFNFTETVD